MLAYGQRAVDNEMCYKKCLGYDRQLHRYSKSRGFEIIFFVSNSNERKLYVCDFTDYLLSRI